MAIPSRLTSPGNLFMLQQRECLIAEALATQYPQGLQEAPILVLGCGAGWDLLELLGLGAVPRNLVGVDLLRDRVVAAHARVPHVPILQGDGAALPLPSASMDLVLQMTVFSSILDPALRRRVATDVYRVLRPGGLLIWFDLRYDNPRNPNVEGIPAKEIRQLFPAAKVRLRSAILAPPLARWLAPRSRALATAATLIAPLRSHYFGAIIKPRKDS